MKLSRLSFALIVFSIACAGYVSFRLIGDSSISPKSDEVIYFRIIQEMFDSGDLMVPSHGDTPFFGKPPLKFWLTMPFLSAFGESNFGYRFLDGLIGFFSLVLTAFVGAKISRSWYVGSLAVLILVTVKPFVLEEHGLRRGTLDNLLVLCCIAALYFLWLVYEGKLDSKTRYFSIAGVFTGLAILTKSYAGFFPVIAFAPIGFWLLVNNKARQKSLRLFCVDLLAFALPALAIPTLYYFPLFFMHPQAWDYAFVSEIGYRVLDHAERVEAPHLYLKKLFAENFVSHSWILIAALVYQAYSAMKINSLAARFL